MGNQARDKRNEAALLAMGWNVVTIWECALNSMAARKWLAVRIPGLIGQVYPGLQPVAPSLADDGHQARTPKS